MTKGLTDKYHFIFYDQRGSLRSPVPDSLISYENHIEDLELLRKELKYSDDKSFEELKLLQEVRDEFHQFMIDNNVDLYAAE